jgi:hypothetical protein
VLAGSYDDFVYAYSVDYGRALGKVKLMNFFFLHDSSLAMKLLSLASENVHQSCYGNDQFSLHGDQSILCRTPFFVSYMHPAAGIG